MSPGFPGGLWDVHVHLPAYQEPSRVAESAGSRGIKIVSMTVSPAEAQQNLELAKRFPWVKAFIGIHPSDAALNPSGIDELNPLWKEAAGIGEVGLDPKYSEVSSSSIQMKLFKGQVELAARLRKPLEVHTRDAELACLETLETYSPKSVLLHWFQGEGLLERALASAGRFISFGPALLFSKRLQRMAERCRRDSVLSESDGPVPFAALGGAEGSGMIPSVVFKLAELWGTGFDDAAIQLAKNTRTFLD